ncbi:MAG: metallophosphoesterase [bacterium]
MTPSTPQDPKLHALLIGVDCYLPNRLPDGSYYPSLGGCVGDVTRTQQFLESRLDLPTSQMIKLTATLRDGSDTPAEPPEHWPTYSNIVAAFKEITLRAQSGEQVYIHYSGHGGRTVTSFPEVKGTNGLDESLVPTDIGRSGIRYLSDVEMAYLLKQMVNRGLIVTVVLDSCHSGGATRGFSGGAVRGIASIDTTERPGESLVASRDELLANWRGIPVGQTRGTKVGGGWMPEVPGTLLLAACRANELANETTFDAGRNGALTYWMLDSLKQIAPTLTFRMLHDRILAKVHATFKEQTPQLHGDGSRIVFGTRRLPQQATVRVMKVDLAGETLELDAGEVQGIKAGARFAIYAAQVMDVTDQKNSLAIAEVTKVGPTNASAHILELKNAEGLQESARAVLLDAGEIRLRGRVTLTGKREGLPVSIDQEAALQKLAPEIEKNSWIRLANGNEGTDYQVAVNANGEYELWDPSGRAVQNLRPALKITDPTAPVQVAKRLEHLTKFRNVKLIDNGASNSSLAGKVTIELVGDTLETTTGVGVLNVGESATLRVSNNSSQVLNLTIFDLQPDWGVTQVYPTDADSEILDPQRTLELPLQNVNLPEGYKEGRDTIKVFATVESTSFRWLELPKLDQPPQRGVNNTRAPVDPLEKLMAAFNAAAPPQNVRSFNLGTASVAKWTAVQLDFKVQRPSASLKHVRDQSTSLLQAAFDEVAAEKEKAASSRGDASRSLTSGRAGSRDAAFAALTDYLNNPADVPMPTAAERGFVDTARYCASMASGMAGQLWNAYVKGDRARYDAYQAALTAKFGDCDPNFKDALVQYARLVLKSGKVPYRQYKSISDSVYDDKLPAKATVGIVADWGTGQPEALEVLRQVKRRNPEVVIHLGDIYYAGTAHEVENYFYQPWKTILQADGASVASFILPGNHDLYSGGQPFYDLLDRIGQQASYFCVRNEHWQLIGLDTALNDRLGGPPTTLDPTELTWLKEKLDNAGQRRTILLSHHQLFSSNERFKDKSWNESLYQQLQELLPKVDAWLWGHEHDLVVFGEFQKLQRGRCIGGSAFPVGKYEMPAVAQNADVPFNKDVLLSKGAAFYQHCYAMIGLDDAQATISYYEDGDGGRLLFEETIGIGRPRLV